MITGIIMASGFSRRMGRNKLLLELNGTTILENVIEACKNSKLDKIIIVYREDNVKEIAIKHGLHAIKNKNSDRGQSESIKLGLMNVDKDTSGLMFIVGDQPFLSSDTIDKLICNFKSEHEKIIVPIYNSKRGNPVIFPYSLKDDFLSLSGDIGGRNIIDKFKNRVKFIDIDDTKSGLDIDTWEQYIQIKKECTRMIDCTVVIRGAGDLATGVGHRLHRCGFKVLLLDLEQPLVIRRTVAFTQAIFEGKGEAEGVKCIRASNISEVHDAWNKDWVAVMVDPKGEILKELKADVLVDAIIAKKNRGTHIDMAPIVVGIGPGFTAGVDVDVVVESQRGHYLGSIILEGSAEPNTGIPGLIGGYGKERVMHSPASGMINNIRDIGDVVKKGDILAYIGEDKVPLKASIDGVLRGLITNGVEVFKGLKIADIDPRAEVEHCFTISDKARAIAGGVLEAILHMKKIKNL